MTDQTTPQVSLSLNPDQVAIATGAIQAIGQAAPAIAIAAGASPQVQAAVVAAQALAPFALALAQAQQAGLLTQDQADKVLTAAKSSASSVHEALLNAIKLHPGT